MDTTDERPEVLNLKEAAAYLRLNREVTRRLAVSGEIPAVKLGGRWRASRAQLDRLLAGTLS